MKKIEIRPKKKMSHEVLKHMDQDSSINSICCLPITVERVIQYNVRMIILDKVKNEKSKSA